MNLADLIADPDTSLLDIAAHLDSLDHARRWDEVGRLDRGQQRTLYRRAEGSAVDLTHFVPVSTPLTEITHDGRNTLPVPPALRRFQKKFCRPAATDPGTPAELFGYNDGPTRRLIGPGYFVARASEPGMVVIDYSRTPAAPVVEGWPAVVPNAQGLQRFVYHQTADLMRRVSTHVSIGAAVKRERPIDHYFVLCRREK